MRSWEQTLIVEPLAGLGNRILVLMSVIALSEIYHKKIIVLWNNNSDLCADFEDLFQSHKNIQIKHITTDSAKKKFFRKLYSLILRQRVRKKSGFIFDINQMELQSITPMKQKMLTEIVKAKAIYIRSWKEVFEIKGMEQKLMQQLQTSEKILKKGNHIFQTINEWTIGLHIRRTDHSLSIQNSPIELFLDIVEKEVIQNERTYFYLATDDQSIEDMLVGKYGNRMILNRGKNFSRDKKQGIIDAMIDMEALSRCKKIYGSYGSTFSRVASYKGSIPLIIVEK